MTCFAGFTITDVGILKASSPWLIQSSPFSALNGVVVEQTKIDTLITWLRTYSAYVQGKINLSYIAKCNFSISHIL